MLPKENLSENTPEKSKRRRKIKLLNEHVDFDPEIFLKYRKLSNLRRAPASSKLHTSSYVISISCQRDLEFLSMQLKNSRSEVIESAISYLYHTLHNNDNLG
jgi:hypothetical protein